jgi:C1A family cysteine protease
MRPVMSNACSRVSRRFMVSALAVLMALLLLMVSRAHAGTEVPEPQVAPQPDAVTRMIESRGFIPPSFSRAHVTGAVASTKDGTRDLPAAYDARSAGHVSPVKNQSTCGSCYAFGTAADLESRLLVDGQGLFDISENHIKECNYQNASCGGGNQFMTMSLLTRQGAVLEGCDPYVAADVGCATGCADQFLVTEWLELSGNTAPDPAVLKQYIMDHGPIHTTVYAGLGDAWQTTFNNYNGTGVLYSATSFPQPNHSVFIVGWNDALTHGGGTGAWIVKNSWGASWGGTCGYGTERGYFYIAYGTACIGQYSSVIKEYMINDASFQVLSIDEGGCTGGIGFGSTTAWGMVKVTAPEDTYLHRVEFWTTDVTTDVDVRVYGSFSGSTTSNQLAAMDNLSFTEPGYHYAQLPEPLALTAGQSVYLAVKTTNQSDTFPVAVDGDGPVNSGASYYGLNGTSWNSSAGNGFDVTIRARISETTELAVDDPGQDLPPSDLPADLQLTLAYPNPFNPNTTIAFEVAQTARIDLAIYDLKGARVRTLVQEDRGPGSYEAHWDGRSDEGLRVPSGVYFCRAGQEQLASSLKLVLLK